MVIRWIWPSEFFPLPDIQGGRRGGTAVWCSLLDRKGKYAGQSQTGILHTHTHTHTHTKKTFSWLSFCVTPTPKSRWCLWSVYETWSAHWPLSHCLLQGIATCRKQTNKLSLLGIKRFKFAVAPIWSVYRTETEEQDGCASVANQWRFGHGQPAVFTLRAEGTEDINYDHSL